MRFLALLIAVPFFLNGADVKFAVEVQPILAERCSGCHAGARSMGGVRFDKRTDALAKGKSGESPVVPGDADASVLLRRVKSADPRKRMPFGQKALSTEQIATLEQWIRQGAV